MRTTSAGFAASTTLMVVASLFASRPQQPPPKNVEKAGSILDRDGEVGKAALMQRDNDGFIPGGILLPPDEVSLDDEKEIAGLAKGSKPEIVTWERLYALAVVRARAGRGSLLQMLDPAALGRQADRLGVADFARFRDEFFAAGAFQDPAPETFALLARLQAIDNMRRHLALLENLRNLIRERAQHPSSGLSRLDLDIVLASSVKARQAFDHQKTQFRDRLDELKVALGLAPQAAIILDRKALAGIHETIESVASWNRYPRLHPDDLTRVFDKLPELGDLVLDGQPVLGAIDVNPDRWKEILTKAARLALEKPGDPAGRVADESVRVQIELHIRRQVRHLVELRRAYVDARQGYSLAVLTVDQAFERLFAKPSDGGFQRSLVLERLIDQAANVTSFEDQLAELWTTFRAERLALYRELGVLPYTDWKSYYADLTARRKGA